MPLFHGNSCKHIYDIYNYDNYYNCDNYDNCDNYNNHY